MSTRAQVLVKDEYSSLSFYRHSDGYEEGTMPTLNKFLDLVKSRAIRDNVGQACGWLILIGREEYEGKGYMPDPKDTFGGWKVGAYEPMSGFHSDIEYLYIVDLVQKKITVHRDHFEEVLKVNQ